MRNGFHSQIICHKQDSMGNAYILRETKEVNINKVVIPKCLFLSITVKIIIFTPKQQEASDMSATWSNNTKHIEWSINTHSAIFCFFSSANVKYRKSLTIGLSTYNTTIFSRLTTGTLSTLRTLVRRKRDKERVNEPSNRMRNVIRLRHWWSNVMSAPSPISATLMLYYEL